jgi:hypothetical protein
LVPKSVDASDVASASVRIRPAVVSARPRMKSSMTTDDAVGGGEAASVGAIALPIVRIT